MQVALVDRRLPQPPAHALERLLEVPEGIAALHFHRAGVVALADAVGALDEGGHRALQLAHRAPRQYPGDARAESGECQTQKPREAQPRGIGRLQAPAHRDRCHRRGLLQHQREICQRRRGRRARDVLDVGAHGRTRRAAECPGRARLAAAIVEQRLAGSAGHRDRRHARVVHEGLQPAHHAARVPGAHRAGDRVGRVHRQILRARCQLRGDALARGRFRERAQGAGVRVVPYQEERDDRRRREQHHEERDGGVLELETGGGHVRGRLKAKLHLTHPAADPLRL